MQTSRIKANSDVRQKFGWTNLLHWITYRRRFVRDAVMVVTGRQAQLFIVKSWDCRDHQLTDLRSRHLKSRELQISPQHHYAWTPLSWSSLFSPSDANKLPGKHACNHSANKHTRIARQECSHSLCRSHRTPTALPIPTGCEGEARG